MIDPSTLTAWDVETWGSKPNYALQPFRLLKREAWLTSCAVAYWDGDLICTEALRLPTPQQLSDWLDAVIAAGHYVVCWNTAFDVAWLLAMDLAHPEVGLRAKVFKVKWLDAMLLYRHTVNAPRYRPEGRVSLSLKQAVAQFMPASAGYEDDVSFDPQTPEEWDKLLLYNQRDCRFTLALTSVFLGRLTEDQVRCALIEARTIPMVAESMVHGLVVNTEQAAVVGARMDEQRKLAFVKLKMNHPEVDEKVLASPTKLRKLLFETWGLTPVNYTETDEYSTDKETLLTLGLEDPRAKLVHEYREATYLKAKFSTGLIGADIEDPKRGIIHTVGSVEYNGDGCTRPAARIFGTYTGRMTYSSKVGRGAGEEPSGCAIHQWKRGSDYRKIITVPEGYELLEFDFAGQEFRWMAVLSGDITMLSLCEPGEDAHAYMAARIVGSDYAALRKAAKSGDETATQNRYLGKVANLSLQYRTSPKTLMSVAAIQYGVKLTLEEARAIHATYLTTYRGVRPYWRRQVQFARTNHYVETLAGRRVHLGDPETWKFTNPATGEVEDWTWGHESTAINFPIQGIGGDQKYLALLCLRDALNRYDARFYMELHDGLFIVAPKAKADRASVELKHMLSNLPYKRAWNLPRELPIAFPVDGKRGPSWGELQEVH